MRESASTSAEATERRWLKARPAIPVPPGNTGSH
jgi:hypothetical protein